MGTKRKRSRKLTNETIAKLLAEADRDADATVAKRFGVSAASIRAWRKEALSDPELGRLLLEERRALLDLWRYESAATSIAIARRIRAMIENGEDLPFALVGAAKVYGALNVEAGALLGPPAVANPETSATIGGMEARH